MSGVRHRVLESEARWEEHGRAWRDPAEVVAGWHWDTELDPALLRARVRGRWWDLLDEAGITLLVTREYEHFVLGLTVAGGRRVVTYLPLPHPNGLAVDRERGVVHVASTRNPNAIYDFSPVVETGSGRPLLPDRARFLPGSLYLHDLAMVGGRLHANAVGQNAVVRLDDDGSAERVWWPKCVETEDGPDFSRNYLQLNSIAAGPDLEASYFSASSDRISRRRPGHRNYPVDRRGVIFSGATREPVVFGLTRPHSARLHCGRVWVDNSGYGELAVVAGDRVEPVARLPGWTRGLCLCGNVAYVGTSRVIPRFRQYAPGLDVEQAICGLHAVDVTTGAIMGSLLWPDGNQIFAVEWMPREQTTGFPRRAGRRSDEGERRLFSTY